MKLRWRFLDDRGDVLAEGEGDDDGRGIPVRLEFVDPIDGRIVGEGDLALTRSRVIGKLTPQ